MDLKTFRGPSTRAVLRRVQAEMGAEALVLDTREVRAADGRSEIEVVVARERKSPAGPAAGAEDLSFDDLTRLCQLAGRDTGGKRAPATRPPAGGEARTLVARLVASEVRPAVAARLVSEARATGAADLEEALQDGLARVLGATLPAHSTRPRVLAFIGPTGVGKTTTIAKVGARLGVSLGRKVGLVGADAHRVGAVEQLRVYADLLGMPFRAATSGPQLDGAVRSLGACDWVLVDTAGQSPRWAARDTEWRPFFRERPWLERVLVLAANTKERDLDAAVDAFWGLGPGSLVFTKIDEASALGSIVNQAVRTGLPVGFLANGQSVPEDLVVTSARGMADLVLRGAA